VRIKIEKGVPMYVCCVLKKEEGVPMYVCCVLKKEKGVPMYVCCVTRHVVRLVSQHDAFKLHCVAACCSVLQRVAVCCETRFIT